MLKYLLTLSIVLFTTSAHADVIASNTTKQALSPFVKLIPQWTDVDVLIISETDLKAHGYKKRSDTKAAFDKFLHSSTVGSMLSKDQSKEIKFFKSSYVSAILESQFTANRIVLEGGTEICAISVPNVANINFEKFIGAITGLYLPLLKQINKEPPKLVNVPGNKKDWVFLALAHEVRHCRDKAMSSDSLGKMFAYERDADQFAIDMYLKHARDVLGRNNTNVYEVPQALVALRSLRVINGRMKDLPHGYGPALTIGDNFQAITGNDKEMIKARHRVKNAVWNYAVSEKVSYSRLRKQEPKPKEIYKAALELKAQGTFDNQPIEKQFLASFLHAAKAYYPNYFLN